MAREIKAASDLPPTPVSPVNDYKDRLVKLIPSEIITAYVTLKGLINGAGEQGNKQLLLWIVFGILVIMNPLYLYYVTNVKKAWQIVFSSIAFVLWVLVIGGTFNTILRFSAEYIGSILLVIYTLFIPFVYKG
jgi:DMSO reductase anchor subunit